MNARTLKQEVENYSNEKESFDFDPPEPRTMTPEFKSEIEEFIKTLPRNKKSRYYRRAVERHFKISIVTDK